MNVIARMVTQEQDGIPGYIAHPEGPGQRPGILMVHHAHGVTADYKIDAYRLACLGFNVLAPDLFNMFGIPGTDHIGAGARSAGQARRRGVPGQDGRGLALPDRPHALRPRAHGLHRPLHGRAAPDPVRGRSPVREGASCSTTRRSATSLRSSHRPRHAFHLAKTLQCASLVFCARPGLTSRRPPSRARSGRASSPTASSWSGTSSPTPTTASAIRTTRASSPTTPI